MVHAPTLLADQLRALERWSVGAGYPGEEMAVEAVTTGRSGGSVQFSTSESDVFDCPPSSPDVATRGEVDGSEFVKETAITAVAQQRQGFATSSGPPEGQCVYAAV